MDFFRAKYNININITSYLIEHNNDSDPVTWSIHPRFLVGFVLLLNLYFSECMQMTFKFLYLNCHAFLNILIILLFFVVA